MKAYRLIINYPSLFQEHKKGDIVYYNSLTKNYVKAEAPHYSVSAYDVENYPDCWELIEEENDNHMTITGIMADFLDSIRAYEHESGEAIHFDERESSEFVDMYFNNEDKLKTEKKEPLFITEDGIKITEHRTAIILVDADFIKHYKPAIDCNINTVVATTKLFFHESNADEYIWKNKRVFSYEDIIEHAYNNPKNRSFIEKLAKERNNQ